MMELLIEVTFVALQTSFERVLDYSHGGSFRMQQDPTYY